MKLIANLTLGLFVLVVAACNSKDAATENNTYILFEQGCYPHVTLWKGKYYYTMQPVGPDNITIYVSSDLAQISKGESRSVWHVNTMQHIWSPELHRINDKWYIYFEADDGNTDNHQLYVLENTSDDPMKGKFKLKGAIQTNNEWNFGIHPTSIIVRNQQYLLWSGWQHRRMETESQCIYIARMSNPWTLASERILLSQPELEWERQWINPTGARSNYPIFVNENPEPFLSRDGRFVCVCYSASGIWTVYNTLGMLYARADANLLDPQAWSKMQKPVFTVTPDSAIYGISNISVVASPDSRQHYFIYEAKWCDAKGEHRDIRMQELGWDDDGLPVFQ